MVRLAETTYAPLGVRATLCLVKTSSLVYLILFLSRTRCVHMLLPFLPALRVSIYFAPTKPPQSQTRTIVDYKMRHYIYSDIHSVFGKGVYKFTTIFFHGHVNK